MGYSIIMERMTAQDDLLAEVLSGIVEMTFIEERLKDAAPFYLAQLVSAMGGPVETPPVVRSCLRRYEDLFKRKMTLVTVDNPTFNATCLPDGSMLFFTGVLRWTGNDEGAIAGIIGHEIAHFTQSHLAQGVRAAFVTQGVVRAAFRNLSGADLILRLAKLGLLRYNREQELESDRLGFVYSVRAGYSPEDAIRGFRALQRFAESVGEETPEYLSTHPSPPRRVQQLEEYAAAYRAGVPLHWIEKDFITKPGDIEKVLGAEPRAIVALSTFMEVRMNLPGDAYRLNQFPRFAIKAQMDGYLIILSFTPDKTVRLLLPNPYKQTSRVRAGETIQVPDLRDTDQKGQSVRLRWDQRGTYRFLFLLTHQYLNLPASPFKIDSFEQLKDEIRNRARVQKVLILDMQEQQISVR
jgi:hypothetical protein